MVTVRNPKKSKITQKYTKKNTKLKTSLRHFQQGTTESQTGSRWHTTGFFHVCLYDRPKSRRTFESEKNSKGTSGRRSGTQTSE